MRDERPIPASPFSSSSATLPTVGRWLWTCRERFEDQLAAELGKRSRILGPALVEGDSAAGDPPAFARMGFRVNALAHSAAETNALLPNEPMLVQVWVPDAELANRRAAEAAAWNRELQASRPDSPATPWKAYETNALLGQVCLVAPGLAAVGWLPARDAVSLAPGGRARMRRGTEAPSRASMKLDEALEWYGIAPGRGDVCVDLGAAPGGWTRRLVERGARVLSVDPGQLAPDLQRHPKVRHHLVSAFDFEPPDSVDWLFCDMAWRPLEVAQLLAKWGRRGWAVHVVSNIKLPMRDKVPVLGRVRETLESGGWKHVRIRQLYHDRDEVTLTARRG